MKRFLEILAAMMVIIPVTGCGPGEKTCDWCESAVVQQDSDERPRLVRGRCIVDGRPIDCRRHSNECPKCERK